MSWIQNVGEDAFDVDMPIIEGVGKERLTMELGGVAVIVIKPGFSNQPLGNPFILGPLIKSSFDEEERNWLKE